MDTNIYLRNGVNIPIANLKKIIRHSASYQDKAIIESDKFDTFEIPNKANLTFVGDSQVAVSGTEILYVQFNA